MIPDYTSSYIPLVLRFKTYWFYKLKACVSLAFSVWTITEIRVMENVSSCHAVADHWSTSNFWGQVLDTDFEPIVNLSKKYRNFRLLSYQKRWLIECYRYDILVSTTFGCTSGLVKCQSPCMYAPLSEDLVKSPYRVCMHQAWQSHFPMPSLCTRK